MRYIFSRNNGNLGETGCVAWIFDQKGVITLLKEKVDLDEEKLFELALEAGAEDLRDEDEYYEIITGLSELEQVRNYLEGKLPIEEAELAYLPKNTITVTPEEGESLLKLVEALEEHDDVQNVYANFEIAEEN
jgi:transcriptional/translational regulatory protein YebC/TACO1